MIDCSTDCYVCTLCRRGICYGSSYCPECMPEDAAEERQTNTVHVSVDPLAETWKAVERVRQAIRRVPTIRSYFPNVDAV